MPHIFKKILLISALASIVNIADAKPPVNDPDLYLLEQVGKQWDWNNGFPISLTFAATKNFGSTKNQGYAFATYANGAYKLRDETINLIDAKGPHFLYAQNNTYKPAGTTTQWMVFTMTLNNIMSQPGLLGHFPILGRAKFLKDGYHYSGRGLAIFPGKSPNNQTYVQYAGFRNEIMLVDSNGNSPLGQGSNPHNIAPVCNEFNKFISGSCGPDGNGTNTWPNGETVYLKDNHPYKVAMHITPWGSAYWIFDATTNQELQHGSWYSPVDPIQNGIGFGFSMICNGDCLSPQWSSYSLKFTNISGGWF